MYVYQCSTCGAPITVEEIAYLGPRDRNRFECDPFMDYISVCNPCETERSLTLQNEEIVS